MKHLNEFYSGELNENLKKAKSYLEKELKDFTQGFEIYIDDSGKKDQLIISVDELIQGGAEYPDLDKIINKALKKFKLKKDSDSNDQVVFLTESNLTNEDLKDLHERADSKAQRRLFAIALQFKRGNIKESELDEEYAEEIIKISKLPEETLKKFAKTKEKGLPHYVGESGEVFPFSREPLTFPNYMHGYKGTNHMAKAELMKWWNSLNLTAEQQEQAMENILKVQHHIYTQFYLGNVGRAWII